MAPEHNDEIKQAIRKQAPSTLIMGVLFLLFAFRGGVFSPIHAALGFGMLAVFTLSILKVHRLVLAVSAAWYAVLVFVGLCAVSNGSIPTWNLAILGYLAFCAWTDFRSFMKCTSKKDSINAEQDL